jgi:hypothetical protein
MPGYADYITMFRRGVAGPPRLAGCISIADWAPDLLHLEIKCVEVAYCIAEHLALTHPDPATRLKFQGPRRTRQTSSSMAEPSKMRYNGFREYLKTNFGIHRNKTGFDGHQAHLLLLKAHQWMLVLEQHHLFRFDHQYIKALSTMLDEACKDAADLDTYADAAATMHALRVGVFMSIKNLSTYEHAAFTHVFDGLKQGCYMLKASINVESGNKVWKYPLTDGGNYGTGHDFKPEVQKLWNEVAHQRAKFLTASECHGSSNGAQARPPAPSASATLPECWLEDESLKQRCRKVTQAQRMAKTALERYLTLTHPHVAQEVRQLGLPSTKEDTERTEGCQRFRLDVPHPMARH